MVYETVRGSEKRHGVEILRWRIELPRYEELEKISEFYGAISERCVAFCQGTLRQRAEDAYDLCEDPKKRFRFDPLIYRLTGTETARQKDLLSVSLEITLKRGDTVWERELLGQVFCESEQILLSPKETARMWDGTRLSGARKKKTGALILREGELCEKKGDGWFPLDKLSKKAKKISETS